MIKRVICLLFCLSLASPALSAQDFFLADIVIEGNKRVKSVDILNAMKIRPGQTVGPAEIDAAIGDVYSMERFSDISAEMADRDGGKVLVFKVQERPLVRNVRFEGNYELKSEKLREVITVRIPDIYDPFEVSQSVDLIKAEYIKEGYYAAQITADSHVNPDNETLVTFRIKEGRIVRVKDIRFDGNTVFDDDTLEDAMDTQRMWMLSWLTGRGNYNEALLKQDLERIADLYFNAGHVRVKVREPVISLVDDERHMLLLINIEEGQAFHIGTLDAAGDLLQTKDEILSNIDLKPGDAFSRAKLRAGVGAISDFYADQGYAYVNVAPLTKVDDEKYLVDLMVDIEQGPQVSVERINITGNTKTRDKVIRREMKLVEGDLFNATKMARSKARINNLGFFEAVDIKTLAGSEDSLMNINVEVKERPTGTFSVGAGYSSVDGFVMQGSVTQENFLGRGWRMNLAASLGGDSTTYQLGLTDPYFLDTRWTLGFDVYQTDREWDDFSEKSQGIALKAGHPIGEYSRFLSIYRYEEKDIYDVDPLASNDIKDEEGKSTLSSITNTYNYNTTDNRLDPSKGLAFEASWELAGLGGTQKFSKYILDARHFWPWRWGTVFSVHGQIGYVHSLNDEDVPIEERFFLGGIYTIRGFDSREVGPRDENGDYTGAEKQSYFNFEYIFPLVKEANLKGVIFFDVGNAWGDNEDFFSSWRYSTGAGVRWNSPLGPLRLEWGYNLDPESYEDNSRLDFTIGRFF